MNILLVEPNFPFPNKSKNKANGVHKNFVPIGLLKFGALYKQKGADVRIVRGKENVKFKPKEILVTSLFTYWSSYVWESIEYYRNLFPHSKIKLGGIYATLHADTKKVRSLAKKYNVEIFRGVSKEAEEYLPDYSLLHDVEYHATHTMRGCIRRCKFCGTWIIEPRITHKTEEEIVKEILRIGKNKVIFYDNNILANPHIKDILQEFVKLRINKRPIIFEAQSGFDGRLLKANPGLAQLIRNTRFQNIRIAWDNSLINADSIKRQIDIISDVGYKPKDISIFVIYNFDIPYEDMLKKINKCAKWGVQISDCRYRPLLLDYDNYNPHMINGQDDRQYYIHKKSGWTDLKVRNFRSLVRKHNIWIRYARDKGGQYSKKMEQWSAVNNTYKYFGLGRPPFMEKIDKSPYLQNKIRLLNRIKNIYRNREIPTLTMRSFAPNQLKSHLERLLEKK